MEMSRFAKIIEQVWDDFFKTFSPVSLDQLISFTGRIAFVWDEPIVVLTILIYAITRGSDVVSGELGRGTLEMLLAQPVSRLRILWTHAVVTIVGLAVLAWLGWFGTWVGVHLTTAKEEVQASIPLGGIQVPLPFAEPKKVLVPMREKVNTDHLAAGAWNLFALGVCFAGVTSALSAFDRHRWRTIGIAIAIHIVSFVFKILALAMDSLWWMQYLSLYSAYEPQKFVHVAMKEPSGAWIWLLESSNGGFGLGPASANLILVAIGLIAYVVAGWKFQQRDLPAPL